MIFNRLALGTANFGREYNGVKVSESEQKDILDYCQCCGIDMLDTATAYGTENIGNSYFKKVVKVRKGDDLRKILEQQPYCLMAHDIDDLWGEEGIAVNNTNGNCKIGASLYDVSEIKHISTDNVIQIPYSIYDRRFEPYLEDMKSDGHEIHARSIFLRGKILETTSLEPWECIAFCLMNPYIDRVIIGTDSRYMLAQTLDRLHYYRLLKKEDENLLDCRRWKK